MKECKSCTLNDNVFSVHIGEDGLCNYCRQRQTRGSALSYTPDEAEKQLSEAFSAYKKRPYQVLLAYSGGKDSTYTLYRLRKDYNVSVLAVTFDNGFLTDQCRRNIDTVTAALDVDSLVVKPSLPKLAKIFRLAESGDIFPRKALERASSVCTACIGLVKTVTYREAILREIPFVCFGWTPGQAPVKSPVIKLDHRMIAANQKQFKTPIVSELGEAYGGYFLDAGWLEAHTDRIPSLVYPLVFETYSEDAIFRAISSLGWERPTNTDVNSTNCLLNSYANFLHIEQYGFNPYCMEIAGLVREGYMSREDGLRKLSKSGEPSVIDAVRGKLEKYAGLDV